MLAEQTTASVSHITRPKLLFQHSDRHHHSHFIHTSPITFMKNGSMLSAATILQ